MTATGLLLGAASRDYDTPMRWLVDFCYLLAVIVVAPVALYRALRTGKYRRDWGQRRGRMPDLPPVSRMWPRVWVHAVSVGEINAVRGLIAAWRQRRPESEFVISTTTDTGQERARELFPDLLVVRYPLDFSRFVNRALEAVAPTMIVLVELEVWYQFVTRAATRGIPVAVVNGRLSERSVHRLGWVRPVARRMFGALTWVGAQDEVYAERFRKLGVPPEHVQVTGSLKWDTAQITDEIPGSQMLAQAMGIDPARPLWVCGSTGPGEEAVIVKALARLRERHPRLQLAIVPRKPERFDEVARLIQEAGFECVRRSQCPDQKTPPPPSANAVQLGDTMGELRKFYNLAHIVFVGRSLARMGGSDMMEVAALARPMVVGPHTENFAHVVRALQEGQGIRIVSAQTDDANAADQLALAVNALLEDRAEARRLAANAREVVKRNRGSTERTLDALLEIMRSA